MLKTQNSFSLCNLTFISGRRVTFGLSQTSRNVLNQSLFLGATNSLTSFNKSLSTSYPGEQKQPFSVVTNPAPSLMGYLNGKVGTTIRRNLILCSSTKQSSMVSSRQSDSNENFAETGFVEGEKALGLGSQSEPSAYAGKAGLKAGLKIGLKTNLSKTYSAASLTPFPNLLEAGATSSGAKLPSFKSFKSKKLKWVPMEYKLETFQRSNQDTCLNHKPAVFEGDWVQSGELLTDCASSVGGELALGQNLLIAYMPWEGYNFEDAILISERLVIDDLYTSVHIERYDIETHNTKLGNEEITREIPDVSEREVEQLDSCGIVKLGSWVEEGDILVGKITPINKKAISPYQKLLYTILEKQVRPFRDTSLRAPKGIKAKVINIKYFLRSSDQPGSSLLFAEGAGAKPRGTATTSLKKKTSKKLKTASPLASRKKSGQSIDSSLNKTASQEKINSGLRARTTHLSSSNFGAKAFSNTEKRFTNKTETTKRFLINVNKIYFSKDLTRRKFNSKKTFYKTMAQVLAKSATQKALFSKASMRSIAFGSTPTTQKGNGLLRKSKLENILLTTKLSTFKGKANPAAILKQIETIHIYLAEKRKVQVGDKMAGRHGNKGIVSQILPIQDMPYLPDGTPIDMVLNPLGVPSRMNVGQIYECLLGLAGKYLGENYKVISFDEVYGPEASRSFVFNKLYEASRKTGLNWLFDPNSPGKIRLYDGRTGDTFDQSVTVGRAYMLRLVHMVDDKIHMRSTGPYSLVTQQPLRGRSKQGGQRLGEMEVWALEGYGAAFTLLEMLTIKSDDMTGRMTLWSNLILNREISIGTPESFKVLICELQALCMDIGLFRYNQTTSLYAGNDGLTRENETSESLSMETEQRVALGSQSEPSPTLEGKTSLGENSTRSLPPGTNFDRRSNNISKTQFTEIKNLINLP